jgi:regulator of sirC expression with transglutaminase-like and TPR domain
MAGVVRTTYHRAVPEPWFRDHRHATERSENRVRFARIVARPDPLIDLTEACECIAEEAEPGLRPVSLSGEFDALAERTRSRLPAGMREAASPESGIRTPAQLRAILEGLHTLLYVEMGLRGAPRDEWEPRHTYLADVLERGRGLPIALGLIELEIGRRLGLPLFGIGLPGHFILGGPDGLLLDPYHQGAVITPGDCEALMRQATGRPIEFRRAMLRPATRREIIARILGNLRGIYLSRREWANALWTLELLVILEPADPGLRRDRALLYGRVGRYSDAARGLDRYLADVPDAGDADDVRTARAILGGLRN